MTAQTLKKSICCENVNEEDQIGKCENLCSTSFMVLTKKKRQD